MSDSGSKRPQHKMAFIHGTGRLDARRADGADYVADKAGGSMPCAALKDPVNKCKPVPMPQYKMMIDKQRNSPEKLMPPISRWQLEILRRLRHHGIATFFSFIR